ncbi:Caspase domain-containing protein [Arthrobacter subterraneus]|uniref:Caspase domain-containing protein n=1 Tax=Arthrobacter subterraneus TaxID=335973 RepID=A0A1G8MQ36_9MICC|nr:caspase family protein [Arthrobacter subterraneus]SDI70081.1 Caspase domain-containing protein [Arthrobacter subterraneus]
MRKALIVGIDYYDHIGSLYGAVNDAHSVKNVLERHADGTLNFQQPKLMTSTGPGATVTRTELREAVEELFRDDAEISLFYFSGHGYIDGAGGYLCASDCADGHDGLSLFDVMTFANSSPAKNKVIILDSCHSGIAGGNAAVAQIAEIKEGVTILTASTAEQYAIETGGSGVFTSLLVDALSGAAANLVGDVTPGSVYAHIDQSLGNWAQRPVFKTNVKKFVSLRETKAPVELVQLQKLTVLFDEPTMQLQLDPSYEPERTNDNDLSVPPPDPAKNADFAVLQALVKVNLVRPVDAPHMWHAAMESKACELTVLGQHYWKLVKEGLI